MAGEQFTMSATIDETFDDTVRSVREHLAEAGFGVLTEIDIRATMKAKLDLDVPAALILGACRPELAHRALEADPRIATLLPCNVVVGDAGAGRTRVEVLDPAFMAAVVPDPALVEVAADARLRLAGMMEALTAPVVGGGADRGADHAAGA